MKIQMIKNYLIQDHTFGNWEQVFKYLESRYGHDCDDEFKMAIQRQQEILMNEDRLQFFKVGE